LSAGHTSYRSQSNRRLLPILAQDSTRRHRVASARLLVLVLESQSLLVAEHPLQAWLDLRLALAVALLVLLPASLEVLPLASPAPVVVVRLPLVSVAVASLLVVLAVSLVVPLPGSAVLPAVLLLASSPLLDDKHVMAYLDWFCVSSIR